MTNKNEKYTYLGLNVKHEIGGNESVNGNEIELADLSTKRNGEFGIGIKELNGLTSEKLNTIGGVEELCRKLGTSPIAGICGKDIERRREVFGANVVPVKISKSFAQLLWEASNDKVLMILIIAALLSLGTSFIPNEEENDGPNVDWIEGSAILVSVAVVVFVTAFNNYTKEHQFQGLKSKISNDHLFTVLRSEHSCQVLVTDIVVGDVCQIKYGDLLPADGVLIQGSDLKVNESSLTGESDHVKKVENAMLYSGTHVMEGSGRMLVTAVGSNCATGLILKMLVSDDELESKSVLQHKLTKLAEAIGYVGLAIASLTIFVLLVKFGFKFYYNSEDWKWKNAYYREILDIIITGVTVLVVAVPEGLPLAVTIALSYSVKKMMKDNNLVRHLDACETMGNVTTICSDKTGTLTTNRMTVVASYVAGVSYNETPDYNSLSPELLKLLVNAIVVNCAYTSNIVTPSVEGALPQQVGNKTECALLGFISELNQSYQDIREKHPESSFHHVYTFNSSRKWMGTVIRTEGGGYRMFIKGASEIILERCSIVYVSDEHIKPIVAEDKKQMVKDVILPMAADSLRTVAVAYKDFDNEPDWSNEDDVVKDLIFICIVGKKNDTVEILSTVKNEKLSSFCAHLIVNIC